MTFKKVPAGKNIPEDIYVIVEIPGNSIPVKYEIDKKTEVLFVDRFILSPMFYPCNYGYINNTLSLDGDPVDVLVCTSHTLHPGCVIYCRPIGMLNMIDESGEDSKIIAVPHNTISKEYTSINNVNDLSSILRSQISHFFEHYKDLEPGKWTKIKSWNNVDIAKVEILNSCRRYKEKDSS